MKMLVTVNNINEHFQYFVWNSIFFNRVNDEEVYCQAQSTVIACRFTASIT